MSSGSQIQEKDPSDSAVRLTKGDGNSTKEKLVQAAVKLFSESGFHGVRVSEIESTAGVQRGLVKYHFGDMENLWRAAADRLFGQLMEFRKIRNETEIDLSPKEKLAFRIRSFVRYSANHAELNRMMVQEGLRDSWRMAYIVDNFIGPLIENLKSLVAQNLSLSEEEFVHWYYMYVGGGALIFSVKPESDHLFGVDVRDPEAVARHADMAVRVLMSASKDGGST